MSDDAPNQPTPPEVSSKARSHLRSLAHGLEATVHVGGEGLSEALVKAVVIALADHELIKVRLGKSFEGDRKASAKALAAAAAADLTQVIGRIVVLYRPRPAEAGDKRPRIQLPRGS